ncbi:hypothetical protein GJ496_002638 [Pomphorhynchus laevis]|nr:hypothetical protein GJ496_002638 [Pomphorhynchus laevis]
MSKLLLFCRDPRGTNNAKQCKYRHIKAFNKDLPSAKNYNQLKTETGRPDSVYNYVRPVKYIHSYIWIAFISVFLCYPIGLFALKNAVYACEFSNDGNPVYWPEQSAQYSIKALKLASIAIIIGIGLWTSALLILWMLEIKYGLIYFENLDPVFG